MLQGRPDHRRLGLRPGEDRRRSREAGFDHHLVKPVDYDALMSLLARQRPIEGGLRAV